MYIANYLCDNYGRDTQASIYIRIPPMELLFTQVTKLLDNLQFVFIPIANPDGYEVGRGLTVHESIYIVD